MSLIHLFLKPLGDPPFFISNVHCEVINFFIVIVSVSKPLVDLVNDPSDSLENICNRFDTPLAGLGNHEDVAKYYHYDVLSQKIVIVIFSGSKLLEDLVNDSSDFLDEICQCLDTPTAGLGNYENIAKHYGYKVSTIRSRFKASPDGPSKALILAMICEHPRVTVENFARVVEKKAKRKNVAILLRDFDRK